MAENQSKPIQPLSQGQIARFWAKVDIRTPDECWPWTASRADDGYGWFRLNGSMRHSNRVAFAIANNSDCVGICVLHSCDNPPCCNPKHLFAGSHVDNMDDKTSKGRESKGDRMPPPIYGSIELRCPQYSNPGESHPLAILTDDAVRNLRLDRKNGMTYKALGEKYGVSLSTAAAVYRGRLWKHVV